MINITKTWKDRFAPPASLETSVGEQQKTVWVTSFPKLLKLSRKEKQLNQNAMIAYQRPQTLSQNLTRYKKIAHERHNGPGSSDPCGRCKLCGNFGTNNKSMVHTTNEIQSKSGNSFILRRRLNCSDSGIYVATCTLCQEQYVGQTITSFATRWNSHRKVWNDGVTEDGDRAALLTHYKKKHNGHTYTFAEAFLVTFIDRPNSTEHLDIMESNWICRLQADININKTILPHYR